MVRKKKKMRGVFEASVREKSSPGTPKPQTQNKLVLKGKPSSGQMEIARPSCQPCISGAGPGAGLAAGLSRGRKKEQEHCSLGHRSYTQKPATLPLGPQRQSV